MNQKKSNTKNIPSDTFGKKREKMPTIHRNNITNQWNDPQIGFSIATKRERNKIDAQITRQRRQMALNASIVSRDSPDWLKNTYRYYYKRGQPARSTKLAEQEKYYDILNQRRKYFDTVDATTRQMPQSRSSRQTSSVGSNGEGFYRSSRLINKSQVSPKVGSIDQREYSYKQTLLKIGKDQYVNTYSPF